MADNIDKLRGEVGELIDAHGLTQRDAARTCARDVSWVQRRLVLLGELPQALLEAVRSARVSSWAATRVFVPLARANSDHASRLLASLGAQMLSTRELRTWFDHYQGAQREQRPLRPLAAVHSRRSEKHHGVLNLLFLEAAERLEVLGEDADGTRVCAFEKLPIQVR